MMGNWPFSNSRIVLEIPEICERQAGLTRRTTKEQEQGNVFRREQDKNRSWAVLSYFSGMVVSWW